MTIYSYLLYRTLNKPSVHLFCPGVNFKTATQLPPLHILHTNCQIASKITRKQKDLIQSRNFLLVTQNESRLLHVSHIATWRLSALCFLLHKLEQTEVDLLHQGMHWNASISYIKNFNFFWVRRRNFQHFFKLKPEWTASKICSSYKILLLKLYSDLVNNRMKEKHKEMGAAKAETCFWVLLLSVSCPGNRVLGDYVAPLWENKSVYNA